MPLNFEVQLPNSAVKKIIVPVDFSNASATALRFAHYLSAITRLPVTAVYVYNPLVVTNQPETAAQRNVELRSLRQQLRSFVSKHTVANGTSPPVESEIAEGIPPEHIKWRSLQKDVAMIVMTGAGGGGRRDLFGQTASLVSEEGGCPIVLIPRNYGKQLMYDTAALFRSLDRDGSAVVS